MVIHKARFIAHHYKLVDCKLGKFTAAECEDIEEIYDLLTVGEHRRGVSLTILGEVKITKETWRNCQSQALLNIENANQIKIEAPAKCSYSLFGQTVEIEHAISEFTHLKTVEIQEYPDSFVRVAVSTSAYSQHVLRTQQNFDS